MDVTLSLMMTAIALFQEAETPSGQVPFLQAEDEPVGTHNTPLELKRQRFRDEMSGSIADTYKLFEGWEKRRQWPNRSEVYAGLRKMAVRQGQGE